MVSELCNYIVDNDGEICIKVCIVYKYHGGFQSYWGTPHSWMVYHENSIYKYGSATSVSKSPCKTNGGNSPYRKLNW